MTPRLGQRAFSPGGGTIKRERRRSVENGRKCLPPSSSAFTLIEMVIAIFILLLLLGLAVPSLNGVLADRRLHRTLDRFNDMVRIAHERSLADRRALLISWGEHEVALAPAAFRKGESTQPFDRVNFAKGEKWELQLPAALSKRTAPAWIFWESGVCEPARVRYSGPIGNWTAEYSPLNATGELTNYAPK